jgi:hypothetical protein
MTGINKYLDIVEIILQDDHTGHRMPVWINVFDNSLSRKWLLALNHLLIKQHHLEKNYCFFGFVESDRNAQYICEQINDTILAINSADIGYQINDEFTVTNTIDSGRDLIHDKFNNLHRYFEDLQGVSGNISPFYLNASDTTKWHIRQLNLLCHEYESLVLSMRKAIEAPEWRRPSQLMCWLNAPRFALESEDYELFGIETINRPLGGVFVGVNKAVGKHHYEVFMDEGRWGAGIEELTTTTLKSQTEAAGDFDIEWANDPGKYHWQQQRLAEFRVWLINNGFDPDDKSLTIGHPQCGQVDLTRSFGTEDYRQIWNQLGTHLNVVKIKTQDAICEYNYNWSDTDYAEQQIKRIQQGN